MMNGENEKWKKTYGFERFSGQIFEFVFNNLVFSNSFFRIRFFENSEFLHLSSFCSAHFSKCWCCIRFVEFLGTSWCWSQKEYIRVWVEWVFSRHCVWGSYLEINVYQHLRSCAWKIKTQEREFLNTNEKSTSERHTHEIKPRYVRGDKNMPPISKIKSYEMITDGNIE